MTPPGDGEDGTSGQDADDRTDRTPREHARRPNGRARVRGRVASVREFAVELAGPLATAAGEIHRRRGVLIGAVHPDGSTGVGEATPLPGWTESYEDCLATIEARRRAGTDGDPEGRVESPGATGGSSPRTAGTGGPRSTRVADDADERPVAPAADHGIELARLDASARAAGESLAAFLADGRDPAVEAPERVPVNATVGDGDRAETVAAAEAARESGYGCLKLKVGVRSVTADVARVEAVRDAVGDAVDLRVDANGAWDREQARRALSALDGTLEYVEQPLPAPDIEGHADLRGVGPPIALDESLASHDPVAVLSADAADVLIVKPMALGGLDRARRVARRAATTGVDAVVTTTIDAAVARVGAVHLAASLQSDRACGLATGGLLADDLLGSDPAPIVDGAVRVPDGDGLGDAFAPLRGGGGAR